MALELSGRLTWDYFHGPILLLWSKSELLPLGNIYICEGRVTRG